MDKKRKPLVSIIITTKNEIRNIERLLKSIVSQTYKNIEIVVVDNKSSDSTKEISKKYTKKVYDKGPERSAQRNFGVKKSAGDWVMILDADMELTSNVVKDCVEIANKEKLNLLVIPEKTVGEGLMSRIRQFEREMYVGDNTIEVARFFNKHVFEEYGGYDVNLTGPEDYDLPYRISKEHRLGRSRGYIYHHEASLSLLKLLQKKYYYASKGALYAQKHPELIKSQGNLLFRKAYFKNINKFARSPLIGFLFIFVRILETIFAILGYISAVGFKTFLKTLINMFKR